MSGIAFESLETHLNTLISRGFLANWFRTIFCIFICSLPDIHLFLINCNLFVLPTSTRLLIVSARFHLFTSRFYYFLLVYHLPVVFTRLRVVSTCFYPFYQTFPLVYQSLHILVLTQESYPTSNIKNLLLKNLKVLYLVVAGK